MIKLSDFLKALLKFTIVNRVSLLFILIPMTAANSVNVHTGDPFSQLAVGSPNIGYFDKKAGHEIMNWPIVCERILGKGCGQILERNWRLSGRHS